MSNQSVIDILVQDDVDTLANNEDLYIPKRCHNCNNALICNILPAAIGFFRLGIKISIDECPYFNKTK